MRSRRNRWFVLALLTTTLSTVGARSQVADTLSVADELALRLILSEEERKEFDRLKTQEEKIRWIKIFWKRNDPTPTTERNERLEEHLRRVEYARKWFSAPKPLGFDDRGVIYVKYGEPSQRYSQPAGDMQLRPNESWSYSDLIPGLVFDFVSQGPYYRVVDDLSQAIGLRSEPGPELYNLLNLYESRSHIDSRYDRLASELRRTLGTDFSENPLSPGQQNPMLGNINLARQQIAEFVGESKKVQAEAPPVVYKYDYGRKPLAIAQSMARFREPDGRVRVEVYYGVPYNQLQFASQDGRWVTPLKEQVVIFDEEYEPVLMDSSLIELTAPSQEAVRKGAYISQFNFVLDPGSYHLALRFENEPGNRLGIVRSDFFCPTFPSDSLRLSDLQLSPRITSAGQVNVSDPAAGRQTASKFIKHGVRIVPLPGLTISKTRPLYIYFEIYGLTLDSNRRAKYEIQYRLRTLKKEKSLLGKIGGLLGGSQGLLSVTEVREGVRPDEIENIALDLSQQPDGNFLLEVLVRDLNSGRQASSAVPVKLVSM
jgi:GWxTD domain-containing protein